MSTASTLIQPQEVVNDGILNGGPPAEIRFLRPLLCEAFYLDLIATKTNPTSNYNPAICPVTEAYPSNPVYESLWKEYLLPFLSYCVLFQSAPFIAVQIASNGILAGHTQFSETKDISGAKYIQDTLLTTIEILKEDLRRHLCENKELYPLFCADCHCVCDCNGEGCHECKNSKVHAPRLGVVLYNKNKRHNNKNNNNDYFKF
jgi:hypothetical protein